MVPWWANRQEGVKALAQDMSEAQLNRSGGAEYRVPAVRTEHGIGFDAPASFSSDRFQEIEMRLGMDLKQGTRVSRRGNDNPGGRFLSNPVEQYRQPARGFGMTGTGIVFEAGRTGKDSRHLRAHGC
jgi:hypothetical protein